LTPLCVRAFVGARMVCGGGGVSLLRDFDERLRRLERENERLRERVHEMEQKNAELTRQNAQQRALLEKSRRAGKRQATRQQLGRG